MHIAVLSMTAKPLEDALNYAQRQHPLRTDINPLLNTLKPHAHKQRHETAFHSELETWSSTPGGGLLAALRLTVQSLLMWSNLASTSTDMSPPTYTHRQLVETLLILGAQAVLTLLLDEAISHFETSTATDADIVLDILVALVAAPHPNSPPSPSPSAMTAPPPPKRQLTLRDALATAAEQAFELSKTDLPRASMTVRLHRRVESLLAPPPGVVGGVVGGVGVGGSAVDGVVAGQAVAAAADALMRGATGVVHNAEGLPTADIDDVLVEADRGIVEGFLGGEGSGFLRV